MSVSKTKVHVIDLSDENGVVVDEDQTSVKPPTKIEMTRKMADENFKKRFVSTRHLCSHFADDFGIAGVKVIARNSAIPLRRVLWIVILLCCLGLTSRQIYERIAHFASFPSNVNIKLKYVEEVTFPVVAICNFNVFRKSSNASDFTDIFLEMLLSHNPGTSQSNVTETASIEFYMKHSSIDGMIIMPTWRMKNVSEDAFKPILTDFGVCSAFNTGDDGYGIRKVDNTGTRFGLSMFLDTRQWDYTLGPRYGVGLQMMLYSQNEIPLMTDLGFSIAPGEAVRVGIDVTHVTNLPPPHGICGEKDLTYYKTYSKNACKMECYTDYVVEKCGCKVFFMPGNATVCDINKTYGTCAREAAASFINQTSRTCDCPVPCSRVIYKPNLSHARFPSDVASAAVETNFGLPPYYLLNNVARVDVFLQELSIHEIKQQVAYDISGLLSDIGGSIGLWLGGSILTIIEAVDILFSSCCNTFWH